MLSIISYSAAICAGEKHESFQQALGFLAVMQKADVRCCISAATQLPSNACKKLAGFQQALGLLAVMQKADMRC